jgi:hypothetical protein
MTLQFPAGAYAAATSVVASAFDGPAVASVSGPVRWVDSSNVSWEVLEALDVQVPSEPAQPVTLTAPVPPGTAVSDLALFDLVSGAWVNPVAPTSVSGGWATFSVAHFSDPAVVIRSVTNLRIVSVSGLVEYNDGSGWKGATVGTRCAPGCIVQTGSTGRATLDLDDGSYHRVSPNTQYRYDTESAGYVINLTLSWGHVQLFVPNLLSTKRMFVRTSTSVAGVRGTIFDVTSEPCGGGYDEDFVDCTEGDVDVVADGIDTDDPAGKELTIVPLACTGAPADGGVDAGSDGAADAGDCISGTWVTSGVPSPCGMTTGTYVIYPSGSGYAVDGTFDSVTLDYWIDGGLSCGSASYTGSNVVWDGTSLSFSYTVPADVAPCPATNNVTLTPDTTCTSATGTGFSSNCASCNQWGCASCGGALTCPNPSATATKL